MKIIVCVKQVPEIIEIKWTEDNTMIREGISSILNPLDEYAIETALRIKDHKPDSTITVLSMGPPQAEDVLRGAIALGVDEAILLTDSKFAGADTLSTSRTLAKAIQEKIKDFDLIICGQFAIDANTAQTGPEIAEHLDLPQLTYVKEIESIAEGSIVVKREIEEGIQRIEMRFPGLLCMLKCDYESRTPLLIQSLKAKNICIPKISLVDLGFEPSEVGLKGSPTRVAKVFTPEARVRDELIQATDSQVAVNILLEKFKTANILA